MQSVMKAQKKLDTNSDRRESKKQQTSGSSINNMATMQLKNMLNLNSKSNGSSDSRADDSNTARTGQKQTETRSNPRDVPENTKRLPVGPPDNTTKGFAIKRTIEHKSLPKVKNRKFTPTSSALHPNVTSNLPHILPVLPIF